MPKISIVFPAYQAGSLIGKTLDTTLSYFYKEIESKEIEIVVVNDGATDNTENILKDYSNSITILKNEKNMGKGYSLHKAFLNTQSDYILFTDADLPYGIDSVKKVIEKLKQGDLCITGQRRGIDSGWFRNLTHWGVRICERVILGINFRDTQCGIKGFRSDIIKEISKIAIIDGFAFDIELFFLLNKAGIKVDIIDVPEAIYAQTTIKIKDIIKMLQDLLKIRLHKYDLKNLKTSICSIIKNEK